jgi:hypothetical protein
LKTDTDEGGKSPPTLQPSGLTLPPLRGLRPRNAPAGGSQYGAGLLRLAVLVPHRDSRRLVEVCRPSLFAASLPGAWSFPTVVPLARLSRSLTASELKALAASLKEAAKAGGRDGRIGAGKPIDVPCPGTDGGPEGALRFWGPVLDLPVPAWGDIRAPEPSRREPRSAPVYSPFSAAVLCAALTPGGVPPAVSLPALPVFFFRAAAVANMVIAPLVPGAAGYSFRWKIGRLFWLPKNRPDVEKRRT